MDQMVTDLRKLQQIVVISQAGSITAASRILAITQSGLTKSVADVESTLETKLFVRAARGVRLTEAGERFVRGAKRILADTEDLMEEVHGYNELQSGRLRIGVAPNAFLPLLSDVIADFAGEVPDLAIEVRGGPVEEIFADLSGGRIDLALGTTNIVERWPDIAARSLAPLDLHFFARRDHPASSLDPFTEVDLLKYPMFMPSDPLTSALITELYMRNGLPPRTSHYQCDDFQTIRAMVRKTDAVAPVLSVGAVRNTIRREFHVFDAVPDIMQMNLGVAHARSRPLSPAANALHAHLITTDGLFDG